MTEEFSCAIVQASKEKSDAKSFFSEEEGERLSKVQAESLRTIIRKRGTVQWSQNSTSFWRKT